MSKNTALTIAAAATVFVMITVVSLVVGLRTTKADSETASVVDQPIALEETFDYEFVAQLEQQYRQQLDEINDAFTKLQDHVQQLETQNATLRERECGSRQGCGAPGRDRGLRGLQ